MAVSEVTGLMGASIGTVTEYPNICSIGLSSAWYDDRMKRTAVINRRIASW
jgi:hypothetical protein